MHSLRVIDTDLASEAVNQKDPFESRDVKIIFIVISLVWIQDTAGGGDLMLTGFAEEIWVALRSWSILPHDYQDI